MFGDEEQEFVPCHGETGKGMVTNCRFLFAFPRSVNDNYSFYQSKNKNVKDIKVQKEGSVIFYNILEMYPIDVDFYRSHV